MAYNEGKKKKSLTDAIHDESERFIEGTFQTAKKQGEEIKDFGDFKRFFGKYMGENSHYDEEDVIDLFESKECKERMKENVSPQVLENLYGDGRIVERQAISKTRMVTLSGKKINVKSYKTRKGQVKKASVRLEARKWSGVELKFIRARKVKGIKPSKIFVDYNKHFSSSPRSKSSLKTRFYRL